MEKFMITNADNTKMTVDLVRYFKFKNDCLLIYTLNEIDEKGYLKLYLVKVMEELGFPVIYNIKDDKEWSGMQSVIKKVLKEIKNNKRKLLEDLDYSNIEGIKIVEPRYFKLDKNLVDVLCSNYQFKNNINTGELQEEKIENNNLNLTLEDNLSVSSINDDRSSDFVDVTSNISDDKDKLNSNENFGDLSSLEPMEQTLLKQGAYEPIPSIDEIGTISPEIKEQSNDQVLLAAESIEQNENNFLKNSDNLSNINENFMASDNFNIDNSGNNQINFNNKNVEPNYKNLYLAEKNERQAIELVLSDLLNELSLYRKKYGELEK